MAKMNMTFPKHDAGLTLCHNPHKVFYMTLDKWLEEQMNQPAWADDEAKATAIARDDIWTLNWNPDNPVGSFYVAAPSLAELLEFARSV